MMMKFRVGITGGIGSGKSVISKILRSMSYKVYDADDRAKYLCDNDINLKNKLIESFGCIYNEDGMLDRKKFAAIIFNDKKKLAEANGIIHPVVVKDFIKYTAEEDSKDGIIFVESAILLECPLKDTVDKVLTVRANTSVRLERVVSRDYCTKEQAIARMNAQMNDAIMTSDSNYVIDNDDDKLLIPQIEKMICEINKERKASTQTH